jgi:hypothetical protein
VREQVRLERKTPRLEEEDDDVAAYRVTDEKGRGATTIDISVRHEVKPQTVAGMVVQRLARKGCVVREPYGRAETQREGRKEECPESDIQPGGFRVPLCVGLASSRRGRSTGYAAYRAPDPARHVREDRSARGVTTEEASGLSARGMGAS